MKNIKYIIKNCFLVCILLLSFLGNATVLSDELKSEAILTNNSCNISGSSFDVSMPNNMLTGQNIPLNITLPGSLSASCNVNVSITYNSPNNKVQFVTSGNVAFTQSGNTLTSTTPMAGNDGRNFNVFFRFLNHTTCNGEVGTFTVTFDVCGQICSTQVTINAQAANYWSVTKQFQSGDLACGISNWLIKVVNNNPNPSNFGNYSVQGTLTDTSSVPVLVGATKTISSNTSNQFYNVTLQNCDVIGSIITNNVNYNFTLGNGCETMKGTVSADSPPLQDVLPSANFTKRAYSTSGTYSGSVLNMTAGCEGYYSIVFGNNGNVPWTNIVISDDLNIPGLTITSISLPTGWVSSPNNTSSPTASNYTFTAPASYVLNPGNSIGINIWFTVNSSVANNTIISNTATVIYNGAGNSSGSSSSSPCPGTVCPQLNIGPQNNTATALIKVVAPFDLPKIAKCIENPTVGNIYQIGSVVEFNILIGNSGSGSLTKDITDALSLPSNQNLEIIPSSINYTYYDDEHLSYIQCAGIPYLTSPISPIPFTINTNTSNLQSPIFSIVGMPGICNHYKANILKINFQATVLPQNYGVKTNIARIDGTNLSSSVNYTIDQVGVLEVHKRADTEFVDSGAAFNYIIEVTNSGSVALDNINIVDNLPSCVTLNSGITVKDIIGTNLGFTQSGNLNVSLTSSIQLLPGETFIITIPVTKNGGSNCCNESVTAHGTMVTSSVILDANYGDVQNPAACVKSTECCDIDDFDAHLYDDGSGGYNVVINGGSVPIQEIDVAVIDYHVEYNNADCLPQTGMGIFGMLSTSNLTFNGLLLDGTTNNTNNLNWKPGNPTVLNGTINVAVSEPNILNLECCKAEFYFCIKVTVKDVNCNICEKVICLEKLPDPPCELSIKKIKNSYCTGDTFPINWSGSNTSGNVNITLYNTITGSYQTIATNQPSTGSLIWNIPYSITPCDSYWQVIVTDVNDPECNTISNKFIIKCCPKECECGEWKTNIVTINWKNNISLPNGNQDPKEMMPNIVNRNLMWLLPQSMTSNVKCGDKVQLKKPFTYNFTSPIYNCNPADCAANYKWSVRNLSTNQIAHGNGSSFSYNFPSSGDYKITFYPICGSNECEPCIVYVKILVHDKNLIH